MILKPTGLLHLYRTMPSFLKEPLRSIYYSNMMKLWNPIILRKIRREIEKLNNIYDAVEFAFSFEYLALSIRPIQIKYEITRLLEIVKE